VETNLLQLNCSFIVLETSSAVTSGLKRETKSVLVLSGFLMTGSDRVLLAPMQGSLRCLNFLATGSSAGGVLVAAFFLYVMVIIIIIYFNMSYEELYL
jgi:hypothetical protein